ncbi:hypothetical protein [Desulfofalx alkaliphila]|uniref:hypothetical protein n=1 Tax=Desulfofalx alkaliphila TaxID=105483 RepID=UPI0004E22D43|nr:hypothetical protein [Desulfofalx alkaliphila]
MSENGNTQASDVGDLTKGYIGFSKIFLNDPEPYLVERGGGYKAIGMLTIALFIIVKMFYSITDSFSHYRVVGFDFINILSKVAKTGAGRLIAIFILIYVGKILLEKWGDVDFSVNEMIEKVGLVLIPAFFIGIIGLPFSLLQFTFSGYISGFSYIMEFVGVFFLGLVVSQSRKVHTAFLLAALYYFTVRLLGTLI